MSRIRPAVLGTLVVAASVMLAWALARPDLPLVITMSRVIADGAAVVTLGLAFMPYVDIPRYRDELARRRSTSLTVAAAVWLVAELIRLTTAAAATAAVPVTGLTVHTAAEYATATVSGRADLICISAAALVGAAAAAARGASATVMTVPIVGIAALGTAARTLAGHLSDSALGGVAVTLHALAAALWCGVLAAMVVTIGHRGQWARILPRFSVLSLWCVVVLLVGGVLSAAATLSAPVALIGTGYGRLLLAKIVVTVVLMGLAWHNRSRWLPSARGHLASAQVSVRRSDTELAFMAVALTLAAALAVTG